MLRYSGIAGNILEYTEIGWNILDYAGICCNSLIDVEKGQTRLE